MGAKGRKDQIFNLYQDSPDLKSNTIGFGLRVKLAKASRSRRFKRQESRVFVGRDQYVEKWQSDKRENPFEYTPVAEIVVEGLHFKADHAPMTLAPCKAWLRKSFLAWCKKHRIAKQWKFHYVTSVTERTITMVVELTY